MESSDDECYSDENANEANATVEIPNFNLLNNNDHVGAVTQRSRGGRYGSGKSAVWQHFEYDPSKHTSKCKHCTVFVAGKHPGNLKKHLNRHKKILEEVENEIQKKRDRALPRLASKFNSHSLRGGSGSQTTLVKYSSGELKSYDKNGKRHKDLTEALAAFFAANSLAHLVVESPECHRLFKLLDERFKLPSRAGILNEITNLYSKMKNNVLREIENIDNVCVILDGWSRRGLSESYLGILIQYYNPTTASTRKVFLELKKLEGSHTGENIFTTLQTVLLEWSIPNEKISFYVTDNGSNMVKALKNCTYTVDFEDHVDNVEVNEVEECELNEESECIFDTEEDLNNDVDNFMDCEDSHNAVFGFSKRVPCIAHQLMCALRKYVDGSKEFNPIIRAAVQLVKKINQSTKNKELLLKYNNNVSLLLPSQTRWVYTYYVFDRLLKSKEAVDKVIIEEGLSDVMLSALKWKQIEQLCALLEPFANAVKDLEGDSYTTINKVIPAVIDIVQNLSEKNYPNLSTTACRALKRELEERFSFLLNHESFNQFQPVHLIATFFDPLYVVGLTIDQQAYCINFIIRQISTCDTIVSNSLPLSSQSQETKTTGSTKYMGFFNRINVEQQPNARNNCMTNTEAHLMRSKLQSYVDEATLTFGINQITPPEPIKFWSEKLLTYKAIAKYALSVLSIPATSAGIERIFSLASIVQGGRRFRLSASSTNRELFIKANREFA